MSSEPKSIEGASWFADFLSYPLSQAFSFIAGRTFTYSEVRDNIPGDDLRTVNYIIVSVSFILNFSGNVMKSDKLVMGDSYDGAGDYSWKGDGFKDLLRAISKTGTDTVGMAAQYLAAEHADTLSPAGAIGLTYAASFCHQGIKLLLDGKEKDQSWFSKLGHMSVNAVLDMTYKYLGANWVVTSTERDTDYGYLPPSTMMQQFGINFGLGAVGSFVNSMFNRIGTSVCGISVGGKDIVTAENHRLISRHGIWSRFNDPGSRQALNHNHESVFNC